MSETAPTARTLAKRPSRSLVVLAVALRLLALLVSTELAGVAHAILDVTATLTGSEHPDDDCDSELGHECPPGCTNCHCTHGAVAWITPRIAALEPLTALYPATHQAGFVPLDAMPPAGPDLTPLYRPPRAVALS